MKIYHFIESAHNLAAGPTQSVLGLANAQNQLGHEVFVCCLKAYVKSSDEQPDPLVIQFSSSLHLLMWLLFNRKNLMLRKEMQKHAFSNLDAVIFHIHGLWQPFTLVPLLFRIFKNNEC